MGDNRDEATRTRGLRGGPRLMELTKSKSMILIGHEEPLLEMKRIIKRSGPRVSGELDKVVVERDSEDDTWSLVSLF